MNDLFFIDIYIVRKKKTQYRKNLNILSRKEALRPFGYLQGSRGGDVLGSNRGGGEEGRAPSLEWEGALEEGKGNGERKKGEEEGEIYLFM